MKGPLEEERERSLLLDWVELVEERNAISVPGPGIPGAPERWGGGGGGTVESTVGRVEYCKGIREYGRKWGFETTPFGLQFEHHGGRRHGNALSAALPPTPRHKMIFNPLILLFAADEQQQQQEIEDVQDPNCRSPGLDSLLALERPDDPILELGMADKELNEV